MLKKCINFVISKFSKLQLAIIGLLLILAFLFGDSNIFARFKYDSEIRSLKGQIDYYKSKSEEDRRKLDELKSNKDNIEKFARESYLMKKDNEEIFIIE